MLAIVLLLHSQRFHAYVLRTAQQKASEALGSQAQMRDFAVHWSGISPTVDLYGVVIHGAAPFSDPPLLEADALHLGLTVTSLLHKAWYVSDVRIEHPVARIFADRDGRTNLPQPKQEKPSQSTINVFDLGVRHLLLERGEIYYNNRKSELSADVHDVTFQSSFALLTKSYSGTLSYRNGHLKLQKANSIGHDFSARFVATPEEFKLESELRTESSRLAVIANVRNYSQPLVHATYEGTIDAGEFRQALKNPSLPAGILQSNGVVDYDTRSNSPFMAAVAAHGDVRSTGLTVTSQNAQVELRDIGAHYSLKNGNADLAAIHAELLGGTLAGSITMRDLAGATRSHMAASLRAVSLAEMQRAAQSAVQNGGSSSSVANQIAMRGSLNATADATWGKTMQDLIARADATLQGEVQPSKGETSTSVDGVTHIRYLAKSGQLAFQQSSIRTPERRSRSTAPSATMRPCRFV